MGLDMYAQVRSTKPQTAVDFKSEEGVEDRELHYWRKHPNLHGWMESLYYLKGGESDSFNCVNVLVESEDFDGAVKYVETTYSDVYTGGVGNLQIAWIDEGEEFTIEEYDGNESIQFKSETSWITA